MSISQQLNGDDEEHAPPAVRMLRKVFGDVMIVLAGMTGGMTTDPSMVRAVCLDEPHCDGPDGRPLSREAYREALVRHHIRPDTHGPWLAGRLLHSRLRLALDNPVVVRTVAAMTRLQDGDETKGRAVCSAAAIPDERDPANPLSRHEFDQWAPLLADEFFSDIQLSRFELPVIMLLATLGMMLMVLILSNNALLAPYTGFFVGALRPHSATNADPELPALVRVTSTLPDQSVKTEPVRSADPPIISGKATMVEIIKIDSRPSRSKITRELTNAVFGDRVLLESLSAARSSNAVIFLACTVTASDVRPSEMAVRRAIISRSISTRSDGSTLLRADSTSSTPSR